MFGFGKKERPPYRAPREVVALRNRIDSELRENFPNLARYQELAAEAEAAYRGLHAQKEHAEEAAKVCEDLKTRMAQLAAKISKNRKDAAVEGRDDYLVSTMDYLQRKSVRNSAKSLFTEFLEQVESIKKCCRGERIEHDRTIDAITSDVMRTVRNLNSDFLKPHGSDKEIGALGTGVLAELADLNRFFEENSAGIGQRGLEAQAAATMTKLRGLAGELRDR